MVVYMATMYLLDGTDSSWMSHLDNDIWNIVTRGSANYFNIGELYHNLRETNS